VYRRKGFMVWMIRWSVDQKLLVMVECILLESQACDVKRERERERERENLEKERIFAHTSSWLDQ